MGLVRRVTPHALALAHAVQEVIRDSLKLWFKGEVANWKVPQRKEGDPFMFNCMKAKLTAVQKKGYICKGPVKSLTSFFAVPKGDDYIRMVYDGTKSGLNSLMWAPWSPLPTIENQLRTVEVGSFMGDIDFGEMSLNFVLHDWVR